MVKLQHVERNRVKGKTYYYFRRAGERMRLPDIASPEFWEAYQRAKQGASAPAFGTFRHLVTEYKSSADFKRLADETRASYTYQLDALLIRFGNLPAKGISCEFILRLRDSMQDTPGRANSILRVLRIVLAFGVERGHLQVNPFPKGRPHHGVMLKLGEGNKPWPSWAREKFEASATGATLLAYKIALHTGARLSDVLALRWSDLDDGVIKFTQKKTGDAVVIPVQPALATALAVAVKKGVFVVTRRDGRPFTRSGFQSIWQRAIRNAGTRGYTFHGLRATLASEIAEAGGSDAEAQAFTGHRSRHMVEHYTRGARQRVLAESAVVKLERKRGKLPNSG